MKTCKRNRLQKNPSRLNIMDSLLIPAGLSSALRKNLKILYFVWAMLRSSISVELKNMFTALLRRTIMFFNPYHVIEIHERSQHMVRNKLYSLAKAYLSNTCSHGAHKQHAEMTSLSVLPFLTIAEEEEVVDTFQGAKLWWYASSCKPKYITKKCKGEERFYRLTFLKKYRKLVEQEYLTHIFHEGRRILARNRQRRLFTNIRGGTGYTWTCVDFEHPATFDTLALDPVTKRDVIEDLMSFREGKEYYKKIGKAWKRGYLLYGPPGTGKSTMIAAIANFLEYDVYDLELTAIKNNMELKKIFLETSSKSVIVIEDIDCSLNLTGKRVIKKKDKDEAKAAPTVTEGYDNVNTVTLSGLLNSIDGLWSACEDEKIIIFTTNHVDKLDPALIRRGRMDLHIEMSYCTFEAFKVFARNYLGIETHDLFSTIEKLFLEVNVSPADVAEGLMSRSLRNADVDACLANLVEVLNLAKEEMSKR
ncbi:P-loop containing nucleoside triphosphate hydrolases superfamily protein [Rhynchospora pubera]|uniref:P-loop containing nucleoside triphosphate hydrolases superfamily protein n=1 Tax=Rhynchospora pubera TaxID=906938 RepID=A0AAV8G6U2_9POAL|nr:P-loop containing nucleoside triphosphate hydrolases superfamily protein [Rhynchospora pubera]